MTDEAGRLQSTGRKRVRHDLGTKELATECLLDNKCTDS